MSQDMQPSGASMGKPSALPERWVERIFQRMEDRFGDLWASRYGAFPRARVMASWAEDLADLAPDELARGVAGCRDAKYPPTLGEFRTLCRPSIDTRADWSEACEQMRIRLEGRGADRWSRPQVYWAAVSIGAYDLNAIAWEQIRVRWEKALADAKADPIPEYRAQLPAPGKQTITREEAASRMSEILAKLGAGVPLPGTTEAGTKLAVRLMEREASGEALHAISRSAWREVLGYANDGDAKAALEAHRAKQRAAA